MSMDEAKFRQVVASAIRALAAEIDQIDSDEVDWKLSDGVLSVEFESGGVFVLSQQVPVRELWLSAFSRAWHFRYADGAWHERDSAEAIEAVLVALFERKLGTPVRVTNPGPACA
jgi:CyaY protein